MEQYKAFDEMLKFWGLHPELEIIFESHPQVGHMIKVKNMNTERRLSLALDNGYGPSFSAITDYDDYRKDVSNEVIYRLITEGIIPEEKT